MTLECRGIACKVLRDGEEEEFDADNRFYAISAKRANEYTKQGEVPLYLLHNTELPVGHVTGFSMETVEVGDHEQSVLMADFTVDDADFVHALQDVAQSRMDVQNVDRDSYISSDGFLPGITGRKGDSGCYDMTASRCLRMRLPGLSLGHDEETLAIREMSLCVAGARPLTVVTDVEYKPSCKTQQRRKSKGDYMKFFASLHSMSNLPRYKKVKRDMTALHMPVKMCMVYSMEDELCDGEGEEKSSLRDHAYSKPSISSFREGSSSGGGGGSSSCFPPMNKPRQRTSAEREEAMEETMYWLLKKYMENNQQHSQGQKDHGVPPAPPSFAPDHPTPNIRTSGGLGGGGEGAMDAYSGAAAAAANIQTGLELAKMVNNYMDSRQLQQQKQQQMQQTPRPPPFDQQQLQYRSHDVPPLQMYADGAYRKRAYGFNDGEMEGGTFPQAPAPPPCKRRAPASEQVDDSKLDKLVQEMAELKETVSKTAAKLQEKDKEAAARLREEEEEQKLKGIILTLMQKEREAEADMKAEETQVKKKKKKATPDENNGKGEDAMVENMDTSSPPSQGMEEGKMPGIAKSKPFTRSQNHRYNLHARGGEENTPQTLRSALTRKVDKDFLLKGLKQTAPYDDDEEE